MLNKREKAINLRKRGFSYREILEKVPVAKSTLSLWLRGVGLSKPQRQRLTQKKLDAGRRGALRQREKRLALTREIKEKAMKETGRIEIGKNELWLIGTMLYWAEGRKEKDIAAVPMVQFSNSDPDMIKLFIKWLLEICHVLRNDIKLELYIHENNKSRLGIIKKFWVDKLEMNVKDLNTVYFKKHNVATKRKNVEENYFGLVRVGVRKSSSLNRKIAGWIEGIVKKSCRVV